MKTFFAPAACAAAILLSSASVDAVLAPAAAQQDVSFDSFHDYLANYGDWVYSDRWGEVWVPGNVSDDFQPYGTNGYWAATDDYGWVWVSNYEWGDVPFHYGRWVNDPDDGWMWIPGYVWSPAWVAWRHNGDYTGWMPMPPDPEFLGRGGPSVGIGISLGGGVRIGINFNDTSSYYGYSQWYPGYNEDRFARNWVFVNTGHLADRDSQRYWAPRGNNVTIVRNTTNITNYTVVNNYVVNRGVDYRVVERAGGRPVPHVALTQVIKRPQFVVQVNVGVQIQQHMRQINPRGTGHPNSAPAPSATLVQGLSDKVPEHGGHAPAHVFSKTTVTTAPAFKGKVAPAAGGAGATPGPGGAMTGPGGGPREDKLKKPPETVPGGTTGEAMHGPDGMKGPGSTPSGSPGAAPQEEKFHKSETGGTTPAGETMHGPGGNMSGPPEHHVPPQPTVTPPSGQAPATASPTVLHKHENTGGGATGPGGAGTTGPNGGAHEHDFERKPPPAATPAATPPVQREEHRPPPPAATPAATPPVQHEEHKQPPAGTPPPPKPDDKDKKDKDTEPH